MACEGCNCGRAEAEAANPAAAQDAYTRDVRSFTAPAEGVFPASTSSGTAVPLRSKLWFDDKNDPGELSRTCASSS